MDRRQEALELYRHPSRKVASQVTQQISCIVRSVMDEKDWGFDPHFNEVTGSTRRDTHLPGPADFDIGLLPGKPLSNRDPTTMYEGLLRPFVERLTKNICGNHELCDRLAELHKPHNSDEIKACLSQYNVKTPKDWGFDLLTYEFKDDKVHLLDVSVGHDPLHQLGPRYNPRWDEWVMTIGEQKDHFLGEVILLKQYVKKHQAGSRTKGGMSSAACEQLIMQAACPGVDSPLRAAMEGVLAKRNFDESTVILPVPQNQIANVQALLDSLQARKIDLKCCNGVFQRRLVQNEEMWERVRNMAKDILGRAEPSGP